MFSPKAPRAPSLDAIADILLSMTYGEMVEMSGKIAAKFAGKDDMSKALHDWATDHKSGLGAQAPVLELKPMTEAAKPSVPGQ